MGQRYCRLGSRRLKFAVCIIICLSLFSLLLLYFHENVQGNEHVHMEMKHLTVPPSIVERDQTFPQSTNTSPSTSSYLHVGSTSAGIVKPNSMLELVESSMVVSHGIKLKWIAIRMKRMAMMWEEGRDELSKRMPKLFSSPKKILLFPGLLTEYSGYNFAENAFHGGFLGELVQWSDFIAVLHMLEHSVTIVTSKRELQQTDSPYSVVPKYDLLFTDYLGLHGVHDVGLFGLYKCRIRVLDSFGTEPLYNFRTTSFEADTNGRLFSTWNFEDLRQFWTLFPHTPDNSFLGFVVEPPTSVVSSHLRNNSAVIYGKQADYLDGHFKFLEYIKPFATIHGTLGDKDERKGIPEYVVNHGVLDTKALFSLLQSSKLFIGLGFPYEGPGPMEALANGCVFLQPKFTVPHNRFNTPFLQHKPTARRYRSQMPYLQDFVGEPYVYTVDENNQQEVEEVVKKALQSANFSSFVPYEFSYQGMMERVGVYIQQQNFCDGINLAHGMKASASSRTEAAAGAIDGIHTTDSCYKSRTGGIHWWAVDLNSTMTIGKIRITVNYDWYYVKQDHGFFAPFQVSLINYEGETVSTKRFLDNRSFYVWKEINLRAKSIHIDTTESSATVWMQLCAVEVYSEPTLPLWPSLDLLHTVMSKPGQSCGDACLEQNLICEPAFFCKLNSVPMLTRHTNCKEIHKSGREYVDYPPAVSTADNVRIGNTLTVNSGDCIINENLQLLGCAGRHDHFKRICSCRKYTKGQVAIPRTQ